MFQKYISTRKNCFGHPKVSTRCLQTSTGSVHSIPHTRAAWDGLRNEPQPTATISDINPPSGPYFRNHVHILYKLTCKHFFFRWVRIPGKSRQLIKNPWFWIIYFVLRHQASSHNFLSVIFGILRQFWIGICGRNFSRRKCFDRKKNPKTFGRKFFGRNFLVGRK